MDSLEDLGIKLNDEDSPSLINLQCDYLEPLEFNNIFETNIDPGFSIYSHNIRSLNGKINPLTELISKFLIPFSVIALQEIWSIGKDCILPGYQNLEYISRDMNDQQLNPKCGGGVGLFIKEELNYTILNFANQFQPGVYESIWVSIPLTKTKNIILGNIYRPNTFPKASLPQASKTHFEILDIINNDKKFKGSKIYILGDFNIDLLKFDVHNPTNNFLNNNISLGLLPYITKPTHITKTNASLIDNIYSNSNSILNTFIIIDDISDHFPYGIIDSLKPITKQPSTITTHDINKESALKLKDLLTKTNWDTVTNSNNLESSFNSFFKLIKNATDVSFPLKTVKLSKTKRTSPWMTSALKVSSKNKDKLLKRKLKSPNIQNIENYQNYKNLYNKLCKKAETLYFNNQFDLYSKDIKNTWKTINVAIGRKIKKRVDIPDLFRENNEFFSGKEQISEGFCDFFTEIGPKLRSKLPKTNINFKNFLPPKIQTSFNFNNVTEEDVLMNISKLKSKNSCGIDLISNKTLKIIAKPIIKPITYLINNSMNKFFFPNQLKYSILKPVFKYENKDTFNNYRLISILSSFSKLI